MTEGIRFALREYQLDALERMAKAEARGTRKQLGVAATGLGKTVIFCAFAQARGGRTLIFAHRDELVSQAVKRVQEIWPDVDVGIVKAGENDVHAQVVVASIQTLARDRRLDQLLNAPGSLLHDTAPFDLVVVDEAHHAEADTYQKVIGALGAGEPDGPLLLGVTATPDRGDGKGLDATFDEIVWSYDLLWGIRAGFLADVRAKRIVLAQFNLGDVKVRRGDYDAGSAGKALEDADAPEAIVKAWKEHASTRQTIVFTPTVALADEVALEFAHAGVKAAMVHGGTPLEERRALLRDYALGGIQVIANCAVLTEGYDEPRTDCIIVARPTKSRALFTQMIGRGTRRHPDKDYLLVLDVVGNSAQHSLITVPSLFGVPVKEFERDGGQNLTDAVDAWEKHQVAIGNLTAIDVDLFKQMRAQGIAWVAVPDAQHRQRYARSLGRDEPTIVLLQADPTEPDSWLCGLHHPDGTKRVLLADSTLDLVQGVGEDYARKAMGTKAVYIDTTATWRKRPPSEKAIAAARKWRVENVDQYETAGELSDAMEVKITAAKLRDADRKGR